MIVVWGVVLAGAARAVYVAARAVRAAWRDLTKEIP